MTILYWLGGIVIGFWLICIVAGKLSARRRARQRQEHLIRQAAKLEPIKGRVALLDLTAITKKLQQKEGWSDTRLRRAEREYRELLVLFGKYPSETLAPLSEDCDTVWHYHIQFTQKYREDCQKLFGKFIDHNPELKTKPGAQEKADARSRELQKQEFGSTRTSCGSSCGNLVLIPEAPSSSFSIASISSCGGSSSSSSSSSSSGSSCGGGGSSSSCGGGGSSCGGGGCGGGGCGGS